MSKYPTFTTVSPERYICIDVTKFPICGEKDLIFSIRSHSARIIPSHLANLLDRCRTFMSLDDIIFEYYKDLRRSQDRVESIVSRLPPQLLSPFATILSSYRRYQARIYDQCSAVPPDVAELIRKELLELIEAGFLVPENNLISRRKLEQSDRLIAATHKIVTVGIMAKNRGELLRQCLISHIENSNKYGRSNDFVVVDDAVNQGVTADTQQMLRSLSVRYEVPILYAGIEEKTRFANRLIADEALPPEVVRFALFGSEKCVYSPGANRNALLLHTVGDMLFSSDEDTVCHIAAPMGSKEGLAFVSGDPTEYRFFPNRETALQSAPLLEKDILTMHELLLGKDFGTCIFTLCETGELNVGQISSLFARSLASGCGKVLVTVAGVIGKHVNDSPGSSSLLARNMRKHFANPELHYIRAVSKSIINDGDLITAHALGFDNRMFLPPFFPVGRYESGIFGAVLRTCFENGYIAYLPGAVPHTSLESQLYLPDTQFGLTSNLRLYDIIIACITSFRYSPSYVDEREMLQALGRHLIEIGSITTPDFEKYICEQIWRLKIDYISHLEDYIKKCEALPNFWANGVKEHISVMQKTLTKDEYIPPVELLDTCDTDEARHQTQWLVYMFGQLLYWWPRIMESARDLRTQNERLARELICD